MLQRPCKVPIAPMGKLLTRLPDSRLHNCERFGHLQDVRAAETLQTSHRPHGRLMYCSFLQGGGVFVYSGTVTMTSCSITGNTASGSVRAHVETSHRPDGIFMFCACACRAAVCSSTVAR